MKKVQKPRSRYENKVRVAFEDDPTSEMASGIR